MRYAIALGIACLTGCIHDPAPMTPGPAPESALTVATAAATYQGNADAEVITAARECSPTEGVGLGAATADAAVSAVFADWPTEGAVYDLGITGTSELVVVSADVGTSAFCSNRGASSGTVEVRRFEQVGDRIVADIVVEDAVAGDTTINAHLYH